MAVAQLAAKDLAQQLRDRCITPDIKYFWSQTDQGLSALIPLFWLALRQSSPFANGSSSTHGAYTHVNGNQEQRQPCSTEHFTHLR